MKRGKKERGPTVELISHTNYFLVCMGMRRRKKGNGEYFNLSVRIRYEHNHAISSPDAWNFPDVSEETKTRYFQLFSDAFSPAKASESQT